MKEFVIIVSKYKKDFQKKVITKLENGWELYGDTQFPDIVVIRSGDYFAPDGVWQQAFIK